MDSQTGLVEGDWIKLTLYPFIGATETKDFRVERFRDCLGIFQSDSARTAGQFTPLCEMYGHGAGSENAYLSNFGEYVKNPVALWMQIPRKGK